MQMSLGIHAVTLRGQMSTRHIFVIIQTYGECQKESILQPSCSTMIQVGRKKKGTYSYSQQQALKMPKHM